MVSLSSKGVTGNAAFEGYAIDLITEISKILSKYCIISIFLVLYKNILIKNMLKIFQIVWFCVGGLGFIIKCYVILRLLEDCIIL